MNNFNVFNKPIETSMEGYAGVVHILNSYVAVHVIRKPEYGIKAISPHSDIKIARMAAEHFAKEKEIEYKPNLVIFEKPIMSMYKQDGNWYPAKIYPDKVFLVHNFEGYPLNGNQDRALQTAKKLAILENLYFTPDVGIVASENNA